LSEVDHSILELVEKVEALNYKILKKNKEDLIKNTKLDKLNKETIVMNKLTELGNDRVSFVNSN
jgi:hypothetical protein